MATADNTAYTLRANALALRDIAPFNRNIVYAENVIRNFKDRFIGEFIVTFELNEGRIPGAHWSF